MCLKNSWIVPVPPAVPVAQTAAVDEIILQLPGPPGPHGLWKYVYGGFAYVIPTIRRASPGFDPVRGSVPLNRFHSIKQSEDAGETAWRNNIISAGEEGRDV